MYCAKCSKHVARCTCPDIDERLKALGDSPNIAMAFCSACGNHHARCRCTTPPAINEVRSGGQIIGAVPTPEPKAARLDHWSLYPISNPYRAPEDQPIGFQGIVTGHPSIRDGEFVHTTEIMHMEGHHFVTNSGTRYFLGSIDPEYLKQYPDAEEKLRKAMLNR